MVSEQGPSKTGKGTTSSRAAELRKYRGFSHWGFACGSTPQRLKAVRFIRLL